jgi:hypothetical protein
VLAATAAVAALFVLAAPASGNFPQSIESTVPAGGESFVTSSPLPPTATSATVTLTPSGSESPSAFDELTEVMAVAPTPGTKLLYCIGLYLAAGQYYGDPLGFDESGPQLAFLLLKACLQIAFGGQSAGPRAAVASTACPQKGIAIGMRITSSGGQYGVRVKGRTHRSSRRPGVVVACRRLGSGLQITLRARKRGQPLTQVLGPQLGIGLLNRSTGRSVAVNTAFAVR